MLKKLAAKQGKVMLPIFLVFGFWFLGFGEAKPLRALGVILHKWQGLVSFHLGVWGVWSSRRHGIDTRQHGLQKDKQSHNINS